MTKCLAISRIDFHELLVLFLPLSCISNTKSVLEDFTDGFERHATNLGEAEDHEEPANKADTGVEAEST